MKNVTPFLEFGLIEGVEFIKVILGKDQVDKFEESVADAFEGNIIHSVIYGI